jgi:hypothetical protein
VQIFPLALIFPRIESRLESPLTEHHGQLSIISGGAREEGGPQAPLQRMVLSRLCQIMQKHVSAKNVRALYLVPEKNFVPELGAGTPGRCFQ